MKFETARIHFFGDVFAAVRFPGLRPKSGRHLAKAPRRTREKTSDTQSIVVA